ncbi:MAG: DUF4193 family protein, partial [Actinomycetota bacterium]|nr:DUF4193 family protein [Actinomycetota bacterium]
LIDEPDEDADDDLGDEDAAVALEADDEEESDETSLDELLSQRAATRRGPDDSDEDDTEDIMALSSERDTPTGEPLPSRVIPVKDRQEFVCTNCHLVKARSQLADEQRMRCRDCV